MDNNALYHNVYPNTYDQIARLESEIKQLKAALDTKNTTIQTEARRTDALEVKLRADDRLILELLGFVRRVKDGDVRFG